MKNDNSITFIHLSDIHFTTESNGFFDLDSDIRNELENDITMLKKQFEIQSVNIAGILITGDITFSGKKKEYEIAYEWLIKLCNIIDCEPEKIWAVPGNHDVDRKMISNSRIIKNIHNTLRNEKSKELHQTLKEYFSDDIAYNSFFSPIKNYNDFAQKYRCEINRNNPVWRDETIKLNDGSLLVLVGINSTLISDSLDNPKTNKLLIGDFQTNVLSKREGVEYLTLCHHPLDWILDASSVEKMLNARVKLQLFGHKHELSIIPNENYIRINAGATHPSRKEKNWVPAYNWISLSVLIKDETRFLKVNVYPRKWDDDKKKFLPELDDKNNDCRNYKIKLSSWTKENNHDIIQSVDKNTSTSDYVHKRDATVNYVRKLFYYFSILPYSIKLDIGKKLNLIKESDESIDGNELTKQIFNRAAEEKLFEELWNLVEKNHFENFNIKNPFSVNK